jgi:hypothetical protein
MKINKLDSVFLFASFVIVGYCALHAIMPFLESRFSGIWLKVSIWFVAACMGYIYESFVRMRDQIYILSLKIEFFKKRLKRAGVVSVLPEERIHE